MNRKIELFEVSMVPTEDVNYICARVLEPPRKRTLFFMEDGDYKTRTKLLDIPECFFQIYLTYNQQAHKFYAHSLQIAFVQKLGDGYDYKSVRGFSHSSGFCGVCLGSFPRFPHDKINDAINEIIHAYWITKFHREPKITIGETSMNIELWHTNARPTTEEEIKGEKPKN